jgi:hypothetical protein
MKIDISKQDDKQNRQSKSFVDLNAVMQMNIYSISRGHQNTVLHILSKSAYDTVGVI